MRKKTTENVLWVRDNCGELRRLDAFREPRRNGADARLDEDWLRWARDDDGRWYSYGDAGDAVVESLSGDWFAIVD